MRTLYERVCRIAWVLRMTPTASTRVGRVDGVWHVLGCIEGDQPLPKDTVHGSHPAEAVAAAERWLHEELEVLEALEEAHKTD